MTYPTRPWWTPVKLELAFGADPAGDPAAWQWTDVSADLDRAQSLTISRGRPDESGQTRPAGVSARLVNNNSAYTPGHPASPHYPHVRQGVPARVSVQAGGPHLRVPGGTARARVASADAPPITGDLDVRVDLALDQLPSQQPATSATAFASADTLIVGRYTAVALMWRLTLSISGYPRLAWSPVPELSAGLWHDILGTEVVPQASGQRIVLRATLDVDDGAGGWTARFHAGDTIDGPWRPLGEPVTGAGVTSINADGQVDLDVGHLEASAHAPGAGRYYRLQVRPGPDAAPVVDTDFTSLAPGTTSWTDATGLPWTLQHGAEITDWRTRMTGEVADWAPTWPWGDLSDPARPAARPGEARCDITIAGPLRRLGQGAKALQSTLRRRIPSTPVLAYWPLEDGADATEAASALPGQPAAYIASLRMAGNSGLPSSAPLPVLEPGATLIAPLPRLPDPAVGWRVEMVYYLDQLPAPDTGWFRIDTSGGGIAQITGYIGTGGARIRLFDSEGVIVRDALYADPSALAAAVSGWGRVRIVAVPVDGQWQYRVWWTPIGQAANWYVFTTWPQSTRPTAVNCQWPAGLQGMPIGHVTMVNNPATDVYGAGTGGPDDAHRGERALARMRRLATEERLPLGVPGDASQSPPMGPQRMATLLSLLQECADADGGVLYELRDRPGLGYRPRYRLYNQQPGVQLSARASEIDNPFSPVLDDQRVRNDVTVSRADGSSARAVDEQSVVEVGLYDETVTLNLATDAQLPDIAAWRLHRGTWPGMRYPAVTSALDIAPQLIDPWLDRLEGDRIHVTDLPPQHPSDVVDLMTEGLTETLTPTRWSIEAAASPGSPWIVGEVAGDDPAEDTAPTHVDTDGSTLAADVDATSGQLIVQTLDGPTWVTTAGPAPTAAAGDLPVDLAVGGEVVTATAIEPFVWDDFGRSITDGWGDLPCTTAVSWVLTGGDPADRSVTDGQGLVAVPSPNAPRFQYVSNWTHADAEVLVAITPSAVATGAPILVGPMLRVMGSEWYWPRLVLTPAGTVGLEIARALTPLTGLLMTGRTYAAGSTWWVRARTVGTSIQARTWPAGMVEPSGWQVAAEDSGIASGYVGTVAMTSTGNTNTGLTIGHSGFELASPQLMTVDRSVNGVTKGHAGGDAIRLHQPMIVGL